VFNGKVKTAARDVKYVNLPGDAGITNGIKLAHALITNPSLLPESIPIEPYETSSWEADDHVQFVMNGLRRFLRKVLDCARLFTVTCGPGRKT
jgi:hypothetical protein